ncbi:MAG: metal ABC transporter ATP-binding protein [Planctomycetota bacterium]|nr:MAG: metal ABC transporter ATP-binding protein [Planctomycetota bacterium]
MHGGSNRVNPCRYHGKWILPAWSVSVDANPAAVRVEHVTIGYGTVPVLLDCSVTIGAGQMVGIIGPNGAGKTTLIKVLLGILEPDLGRVLIAGHAPGKHVGHIAYVPQRSQVDWDFPITVGEVVRMGRYGRHPFWRQLHASDEQAAAEALQLVDMSDYTHRQVGMLSGGQQQRVFLARALAQGAEILLLDEPLAGVDVRTEESIIGILRRVRDSGRTLLVVHHDLSTAAAYFDRLLLLKQRVIAYGPPATVLQRDLLEEVYGGRVAALIASLSQEPSATPSPVGDEDA